MEKLEIKKRSSLEERFTFIFFSESIGIETDIYPIELSLAFSPHIKFLK